MNKLDTLENHIEMDVINWINRLNKLEIMDSHIENDLLQWIENDIKS